MDTIRVNELIAGMKSFGKENYKKCELLPEMFALQQEMVGLTFNGLHASTADLRIWDVERHLEQLNRACGNVADQELQKFVNDSKIFCNLIKAEFSGNRGESKTFRHLQYLYTKNMVLKNVELSKGGLRTELDAIVITSSGITIIEVKNTAKNIFIDEKGGYYRTGEYLKWDCNIAEKIDIKERLLRNILIDIGMENVEIHKLVVFTDDRIEVQNKYPVIRTCFVSQLAHIIDSYVPTTELTDEDMKRIGDAVRAAEEKREYPFEFDVDSYKAEFATVMAILEEESAKTGEKELEVETENSRSKEEETSERRMETLSDFFKSKYSGYAGSAVAVAALALVTTIAVNTVRKERWSLKWTL